MIKSVPQIVLTMNKDLTKIVKLSFNKNSSTIKTVTTFLVRSFGVGHLQLRNASFLDYILKEFICSVHLLLLRQIIKNLISNHWKHKVPFTDHH